MYTPYMYLTRLCVGRKIDCRPYLLSGQLAKYRCTPSEEQKKRKYYSQYIRREVIVFVDGVALYKKCKWGFSFSGHETLFRLFRTRLRSRVVVLCVWEL